MGRIEKRTKSYFAENVEMKCFKKFALTMKISIVIKEIPRKSTMRHDENV